LEEEVEEFMEGGCGRKKRMELLETIELHPKM